ncbi:MAG TPA: hypothetical protein VGV38_21290 [Pyrinomonadaceae bacterium]|nr:hypothetical protein [Pyrinomonadaceae bacterium]
MADRSAPYVGPRPFDREDAPVFFGRDAEANELLSLVVAHPVVLLYAQSGAGKTSLLNARLLPLLEERRAEVFGTARVSGELPAGLAPEDVDNIYVFNALASLGGGASADGAPDPKRLGRLAFEGFLAERPHAERAPGVFAMRVVVFDQFEEIFTTHVERWRDREKFFDQVGEALERDKRLRVVFSMREEYLAGVEAFADVLPERLRTRYRLERLREPAALQAVKRPLEATDRSFAPGVAEKLVKSLLQIKVKTARGTLDVEGEYVEPVQLQVVCRNLWESLPGGVEVIDETHVQTYGDVDQALIRYYEAGLKSAAALSFGGPSPRYLKDQLLRSWFETELITPGRTRGLVYKDTEAAGSLPNRVAEHLESLHLVRAEVRGGALWYELSHDRFVDPILESNRRWRVKRNLGLVGVAGVLLSMLVALFSFWFYWRLGSDLRLEESLLTYKGEVAANLSREPGKEFDALAWGLQATQVGKLDAPPRQAVEGLRAALAAVGSPLWLRSLSEDELRPVSDVDLVGLSPDGRRVLTVGRGVACVWDALTGRPLAVFESFQGREWSGGEFLAPDGGRVYLRSVPEAKDVTPAETQPRPAAALSHFFDVETRKPLPSFQAQLGYAERLEVAENRECALGFGGRLTARLVDRDGSLVGDFRELSKPVLWARLSPDGRRALTVEAGGALKLWSAETGALLARAGEGEIDNPDALAYSPDSNFVFSPDGTRFAVSRQGHRWAVYDADTGALLVKLTGSGRTGVMAAGFSPDGRSFAELWEEVVRVWDVASGELLSEGPVTPRASDAPDAYTGIVSSPSGFFMAASDGEKVSFSILRSPFAEWQDLLRDVKGKLAAAHATDDLARIVCAFENTGVTKVWTLDRPQPDFAALRADELKREACQRIRYQPEYKQVRDVCESVPARAP